MGRNAVSRRRCGFRIPRGRQDRRHLHAYHRAKSPAGWAAHGFLENVVTHPEFRSQGHGRAVVRAALAAAWTKDCYHAFKVAAQTLGCIASTRAAASSPGFGSATLRAVQTVDSRTRPEPETRAPSEQQRNSRPCHTVWPAGRLSDRQAITKPSQGFPRENLTCPEKPVLFRQAPTVGP